MKFDKTVEGYICDSCGKEVLPDDTGLNPHASMVVYAGKDVVFEWWPAGDYCAECMTALVNGILRILPVPDRYDECDKIANECAVIEAEGTRR